MNESSLKTLNPNNRNGEDFYLQNNRFGGLYLFLIIIIIVMCGKLQIAIVLELHKWRQLQKKVQYSREGKR